MGGETRGASSAPASSKRGVPTAPPPSRRAIGDQLVDEVWVRSRTSVPAYLAVMLLAWAVVRVPVVGSRAALGAYVASLGIGLARWLAAMWITPRLASISRPLRYRLLLGLTLANGVALGALGMLVFTGLGPIGVGVWMVITAGIAGGAVASLGARPEVFLVFVVPMLAAIIIAALRQPQDGGLIIAPATFIWLVFSLGQVLQYRKTRRQFITLNLELDASVRALHGKNADLERAQREAVAKNLVLEKTNGELVSMTHRAERIFSALADALPGRTLDGKYKLESRVGDGGFSVVFSAMHADLARTVAVKIFRPQAGNDSVAALERFRQEGMASTRVRHPNIVEVYDAGVSDDGIPYIAMELLSGHSLSIEMAEARRVPVARIAWVMEQACRGLAAAHAAGVIHRDVKPDNIFVHHERDAEIVKVLDFGIAKVVDANRLENPNLTSTGAFLGTPNYMAPERFLGHECTAGADVYSVGVVLYTALAGRLPYEGTLGEIMMQAVSQRPRDLRELAPEVPAEIADVVMRALEDDPERRPSVGEMADTLARAPAANGRSASVA